MRGTDLTGTLRIFLWSRYDLLRYAMDYFMVLIQEELSANVTKRSWAAYSRTADLVRRPLGPVLHQHISGSSYGSCPSLDYMGPLHPWVLPFGSFDQTDLDQTDLESSALSA